MEQEFVVRILSSAGFNRLELKTITTITELRSEIEKVIGVPSNLLKLYYDHQKTKVFSAPANTPVSKLLSCGDLLIVGNEDASFRTEEKKEKVVSKCNHSRSEKCINCMEEKKEEEDKVTQLDKQGLTSKCAHPPGKKCLSCMVEPASKKIKFNCQHGANAKCPNCVEQGFIEDSKHTSFKQYLNDRKQLCKGLHDSNGLCTNCTPPQNLSYKLKTGCTNHAPYPKGLCTKCQPANVSLLRQRYRHIDYMSFMNKEELNLFISSWSHKDYFSIQKMAFLFGYYATDPNYPEGVRAVVEAMHEPPQERGPNGFHLLIDEDCEAVDRIASALGLECVGWIFTTIDTNKETPLSPSEIKEAARLQEIFKTHYTKECQVSHFVTCVVRPTESHSGEIETYMVSDMCQALERDNILSGDFSVKDKMKIRQANQNEIMPRVFEESKEVSEFNPIFFLVNVAHGAPADKLDLNILKTYDFPVATRTENNVLTLDDVKRYFNRWKNEQLKLFSSFEFLIYISKLIDIPTAENVAQQVAIGFADAEHLVEIIASMID